MTNEKNCCPDCSFALMLFVAADGFATGGGPAGFGDLAGAAKGEGVWRDVVGDGASGGDVGAFADYYGGDEGGVGADEAAIADGGEIFMNAIVVAGDDSGADVDSCTNDRVSEVRQVIGL